jgi:hypothetical protein
MNIRQAGRLHVEPTAGLLVADIAKVPLITARRPADLRECQLAVISLLAVQIWLLCARNP